MIRKLSKRICALSWAAIFLLTTAGEGFGLHPCPYHDGLQEPGVPGEVAEDGHAHGNDHTDHQSSDRAHHHGDNHGDHGDSDLCTHTDACPTPPGAVLPSGIDEATVKTLTYLVEAVRAPADPLLPGLPPFFLPYSHGPPARG